MNHPEQREQERDDPDLFVWFPLLLVFSLSLFLETDENYHFVQFTHNSSLLDF